MMQTMKGIWVVPVIASVLILGFSGLSEDAWAPIKISPTKASPPHPFTIIDTPDARLADGCVSVFKLDGTETLLELQTHKPHKTAQGELPADMGGGDYTVSVRCPTVEFEVGTFFVDAPAAEPEEPTIEPTSGLSGAEFTITDPLGRIQQGDLALFYEEVGDPAAGSNADNIQVSTDGTTLTGNVPSGLTVHREHFVAVRDTLNSPSRFQDLAFFVEFS